MRFLLSILILTLTFSSKAQDLTEYQKKWFIQNGDTMPYRLLLPKNYNAHKKYPLVLFLHGAGERGNDNEKQLVHGAKLFLRDSIRDKYPAIIVFPQCAANSFWSNVNIKMSDNGQRQFLFSSAGEPTKAMKLVQELLDNLMNEFKVNKKQVYVGGLSMGGMGTFEIVRRNKKTFAAAIPICGGGDPASAKDLKRPKWWVFHGAKDNVVPLSASEVMVEALKKANAKVKFTVYPDANHNSWDPAFAEPEFMAWLFAQRR